jgi:cytochrome c553
MTAPDLLNGDWRCGPALVLLLGAALLTPVCSAQDTAQGRSRAQVACAMCHGLDGISTLPNAAHLAGQPAIYLEEQLKAYRSGKRSNEVMAVIAKTLSDEDIRNLSAWYAAIKITVEVPQ